MDWLDQELKLALERKEPSPDFAARVIRRAARGPSHHMQRWLAAAAAVIVMTSAGLGYRHHQGEVAKDQVMLAFKITAVKVNHIQTHVKGAVR